MLHGAAKLAREKSRQRTRKRRAWIAALGAIVLITSAFALLSQWWTFGLVWSTNPATTSASPSAPGAPNTQSQFTLHALTMSRWKFHLNSQDFTAPSPTTVPLMYVIQKSSAAPSWIPPAATGTTKVRRISARYVILMFPALLALAFLVDAEGRALQRKKRGCCSICGYNLKSIELIDNQTTCPECGDIKKHRQKSVRAVQKPLANNA